MKKKLEHHKVRHFLNEFFHYGSWIGLVFTLGTTLFAVFLIIRDLLT